MKAKFGVLCMVFGAVLLLGALSLLAYNQQEAAQADEAVSDVMPQVVEQILQRREQTDETALPEPEVPLELLEPEDLEMTEVEIDGYGYIGYLSLPALELELPVMSDWDYTRLRIAPCRYAGTLKGEDLVLMAHNYTRHFGRLSELTEGDSVVFVDMDGETTVYEVVAMDILAPTAVEEMTSGAFDLTLFTCTYGGRSRVTVYCDRVKES